MNQSLEAFVSIIVQKIESHFQKGTTKGRPKANLFLVVRGIIHRMNTGCQWRSLPAEYGSWKTVHHWHRLLAKERVFEALFHECLLKADEQGLVDHSAYVIDASIVKAPNGGEATGPSPVGRGRLGAKRSIITDARGEPLAIHTTKANRPDSKVFLNTIKKMVIQMKSGAYFKMDKGYASDDIRDETIKRGLIPVIPRKKKAKKGEQGDILKGRHVVEICFSWMNKKRGLATRYDRRQDSYDSILFLWAAMRWCLQFANNQ